jgi:hypothetical protein
VDTSSYSDTLRYMSGRLVPQIAVLFMLLLSSATVVATYSPETAEATSTRRCAKFVAFKRDGYVGVATNVKVKGSVSCSTAKRMLKSTYGGKGAYRVTNNGTSRSTYYWKGGWRCANGAGGAGCSNTVNDDWFVTADVTIKS